MRIRWLLLVPLCFACGSDKPEPVVSAPPPPPAAVDAAPATRVEDVGGMQGAFFIAEGAPDPLACTADTDCTGDTVTDATGCCIASPMPVAQTRAYHVWKSARRQSPACKIECPPQPIPTQPPECTFKVSCADGKCMNACNQDQP